MVWLLSLARSRAIDAVRSRLRKAGQEIALESSFDLADPVPGPEAVSVEAERARTVRLALRSLPSEQRYDLEVRAGNLAARGVPSFAQHRTLRKNGPAHNGHSPVESETERTAVELAQAMFNAEVVGRYPR